MKHNNTNIINNLEKLIVILRSNDEEMWAIVFEKLLRKFTSSNNKDETAREIIQIFHGGMGSFNDLVLQKDKKILCNENDQLNKLKDALFNSCLDLIK